MFASVGSDELIERFRPNLVIQNYKPFEEENWSTVQIGRETFVVRLPNPSTYLLYLFTYLFLS